MPRRIVRDRGGRGLVTYNADFSDAMSLSVDSFMCAREKNKQEGFRFYGRIKKLDKEERQIQNACSYNIKDARKNLVEMNAYKSVYTRYSFDRVIARNQHQRKKAEEEKKNTESNKNQSKVKVLRLHTQKKDELESDKKGIQQIASRANSNLERSGTIVKKQDKSDPGDKGTGNRSNDQDTTPPDTTDSMQNGGVTTSCSVSASSPRARSKQGHPERKAIDALANHIQAYPEVYDKLRGGTNVLTSYTPRRANERTRNNTGQQSIKEIPDTKKTVNDSRKEENKTTSSNKGAFLTEVSSSSSQDRQLPSIQEEKTNDSNTETSAEPVKLVVDLSQVLNNDGDAEDDVMKSRDLASDLARRQRQEAEYELYYLASAFGDGSGFKIERDVVPAREPSLVREFNRGRHSLVNGRPRSDNFPPECRNMFTFRQFIDKQAHNLANVLSPDQLRMRKLRHIEQKVKFPELINCRKTTSAIFRDFSDYKQKQDAKNPHAQTLRTSYPAASVERPKSPMSRPTAAIK